MSCCFLCLLASYEWSVGREYYLYYLPPREGAANGTGRYIGGGGDKSRPTDGRKSELMCIIAPYEGIIYKG